MEENKSLVKVEFPDLLPTARALFKSGLFPNVRNEFGAFSIIQYGFELGIPPMTSLQTMAIISGKICLAGQVMLSIALRNGLEYKIQKDTTDECIVHLKFKNTEYTSSFTIAEAKQAGVYRDNSGWTKFPKDMLFWRAITRGLRRVCPDLILGLYAKEEIEGAPPLDAEIQVGEVGEIDSPLPNGNGQEEPPPPDDVPEQLYVNDVTYKEGPNGADGKPKWVLYKVHATNGLYTTFDRKIADLAKKFKLDQTPCIIVFEETPKGKNIKEIREV